MRIAFRLLVIPLVALGATGCLATKGDMRLLQTELAAARAQAARADSAQRRKSDSLASALATLASMQSSSDQSLMQSQQSFDRRVTDELRTTNTRISNLDLTLKDRIKSLEDELDRVKEVQLQNQKLSANQRAELERIRATVPSVVDTTAGARPADPGAPGPATLLVAGRSRIIEGSCGVARRSFQDIITQYPQSIEAPEAQHLIAESYVACGQGRDSVKADSVYSLVTEKYPTSDFAAMALYKRAELHRNGGRADVARSLYLRVFCEYKKSTVFAQARDRLGSATPVCRPTTGGG